jgi:hypothetical protein
MMDTRCFGCFVHGYLEKLHLKQFCPAFSSISINLHSIGSCWLEYSLIRSKKKAGITSPSVFMPFNGLTSWPKNWRLFVVFVGDFSLVREKIWRIVTLFSTLISLLNCYSCVNLSSVNYSSQNISNYRYNSAIL